MSHSLGELWTLHREAKKKRKKAKKKGSGTK